MADSSLDIARAFVQAINQRDLVAMRALMTEDHTFTDALGNRMSGAEKMIAGWRSFFESIPEYWIRVDTALAAGTKVALFGEAGGGWRVDNRVLDERWNVSAAWLVDVEAGKIRNWSVYCDTGWAKPPSTKTAEGETPPA